MEIQNEIYKLLTLKESFSKIANSYSSLVPTEFVTIQLHAENTDLSAYKIKVVNTTSGNEEFYDISASGYTELEVKYDSVYEIVFPIIGAYITPATRTFTAQKPVRKIEASYVMTGVFGLDEQGNRYSANQIETLDDKSIIKYVGITTSYLENFVKGDGTTGCGFMWKIGEEKEIEGLKVATIDDELDTTLLPYIVLPEDLPLYCDGENYTKYFHSEIHRLGGTSPLCEEIDRRKVVIGGQELNAFWISCGQLYVYTNNLVAVQNIYNALGATFVRLDSTALTSNQSYSADVSAGVPLIVKGEIYFEARNKTNPINNTIIVYPLPK